MQTESSRAKLEGRNPYAQEAARAIDRESDYAEAYAILALAQEIAVLHSMVKDRLDRIVTRDKLGTR